MMLKNSKLKFEKITKKTAFNILILLMLIYFIFHSIYGSRGIIAYFKLQAELEDAHAKLSVLRSKRLEIENRAKLLRPESLDRDMLDEKARNVLGFVTPQELVFKPASEDK